MRLTDELADAIARAKAALSESRARGPKKLKRPRAGGMRPAKLGPSKGCGTGSGGFKVGNQCAKEDGNTPRKPNKVKITTKGGNVPVHFSAKAWKKQEMAKSAAVAAKKAAKKAAEKKAKVQKKAASGKEKLSKLKDKAAKTGGKTGQKIADRKAKTKEIAEKIKAKAAAAQKGKEALAKLAIARKGARDSLDAKNDPYKKKIEELDAVKRQPGESDLDYHMRANKKDFEELKAKIEGSVARVDDVGKQVEVAMQKTKEAENLARSASQSLINADKNVGGKGVFFLRPDGTIKPGRESKLKHGDKLFDEYEAANISLQKRLEEEKVAAKAHMDARKNLNKEIHDHIGAMRIDKGASESDSPSLAGVKETRLLGAWYKDEYRNSKERIPGFTRPDAETSRSLSEAMRFYGTVASAQFSAVLKSIRTVKISAPHTQFAARPGKGENDYDLKDISAFSRKAGRNNDVTEAPVIALRGLKRQEQNGAIVKTVTEHASWANAVAVHEIAHPLGQAATPNKLLNEFWTKRYEQHGRPTLKQYSQDKGREHQLTFDDNWHSTNYSGVTYRRQSSSVWNRNDPGYVAANMGKWRDTEILTMGAQHIYQNPAKFLAEDREHFFLTVGILSGRFTR